MQLAALHAKPPVLCNDAGISIVWIKKWRRFIKIENKRGNRFFKGLSKRTNHRFLQTRETVPLKNFKKVSFYAFKGKISMFIP